MGTRKMTSQPRARFCELLHAVEQKKKRGSIRNSAKIDVEQAYPGINRIKFAPSFPCSREGSYMAKEQYIQLSFLQSHKNK